MTDVELPDAVDPQAVGSYGARAGAAGDPFAPDALANLRGVASNPDAT